jgi:GT2 family glycosyltransferase
LRSVESEEGFNVIYLPENYGFTHAVNVGVMAGRKEGDVVIMNNDAIVTENWLHGLYEVIHKYQNAGIVCPRQVLPAYSRTLKQHCPTAAVDFETDVSLSSHHQNVTDYKFDVYRGFVELSYVPFFCVLVKRAVFDKVGLLDAEFGRHYRSDQVYCDAVRAKDFKIIYTPNSKVYHLLQRSTQNLAANNEGKYQEIFVKNTWGKELAKKLGYREAPWQL